MNKNDDIHDILNSEIYPNEVLTSLKILNNSHLETMTFSPNIFYETFVYSLTIPLFIITATGNGMILVTIKYQARLLSSTSNYFILSLALADFFVGIASMPIMILFTANKQKWIYPQAVCDSWMAFDFLCSSASFLTLSAMSIERYKMLTTSYVHIKHSSKLRVITFICLAWLLPFITWVPVIILNRKIKGPDEINDCSNPADKYIVLTLCILIYHIPLICMVVFYTKLIIHIKKSSLNSLESNENIDLKYSKNLSKKSFQINNSIYSQPNENSYCDRKYSVNLEHFRIIPSIKLKKSNSFVAYKQPRFNSEIQYYMTNSHSFSLLNKISTFFPCFKKKSSSVQIPNKTLKKSLRSESLIDENIYSKKNSSPARVLRKKDAFLCLNDSDYSIKSSLNSRNDFDSFNSNLNSKFKIKNNSLNNFMEYQEILNRKEKHYSTSSSSKKNSLGAYENSNYQNMRLKRNRKAARMLGLLVASFSICWLPFTIVYPLCQFYPNLLPGWLTAISWWMGYLNSTINPFLYVYSNKNIRRSVRILFVKRLWNFLTGKNMNRNFRNDSLRHNILFGSYRNANHSHNNHQNKHENQKLKLLNNNNIKNNL
ncbi:unnamed protein product [Brachionus calyciflorus]|uniref:G-protein coupled receptors family 1 profile domain-containing protein n=1 Tax=Brachionus calyciflorus TaxID=104777 RepID=A0A813V8N4_9BILA|nr:unnamed protein product [Brachionus calyciflorus]